MVQGSFVPGKPQNCTQHFDTPKCPREYWFSCTHFNHTVFLILESELIAYLRLHRATLPLARNLFSHSGKTSSPFQHRWRLFTDWLTTAQPFPSCCVSACEANYFPEIVFFCWAEGLLIKPAGCLCECVYLSRRLCLCGPNVCMRIKPLGVFKKRTFCSYSRLEASRLTWL